MRAFALSVGRKWRTIERIKEDKTNRCYAVEFDVRSNEPVLLKVGLSDQDVEDAQEIIGKEIPSWDFRAVQSASRVAWTFRLAESVVNGTDEEKSRHYTTLYRRLLK